MSRTKCGVLAAALIISASLSLFADEKGPTVVADKIEFSKDCLTIVSYAPPLPATLEAGERLSVTIDYTIASAEGAQIWARPYTEGKSTPGYGAHPSPLYGKGSGRLVGWFTFRQPATVDEVRVTMVTNRADVVTFVAAKIQAQWVDKKRIFEIPVDYKRQERPKLTPEQQKVAKEVATRREKIQSSLVVGTLFPGFVEKDLQGRTLSLADYKVKIVLIDFWATWCGPCVSELPHVLKTYNKYHSDGFEVIGISLDQDETLLREFLKKNDISWSQYFDGQGWQNKFARLYDVNSIPATFLLDREGKIVAKGLRGEALDKAVGGILGQ
jgi:thiol-disulfide isomerase/thioredoxin